MILGERSFKLPIGVGIIVSFPLGKADPTVFTYTQLNLQIVERRDFFDNLANIINYGRFIK